MVFIWANDYEILWLIIGLDSRVLSLFSRLSFRLVFVEFDVEDSCFVGEMSL